MSPADPHDPRVGILMLDVHRHFIGNRQRHALSEFLYGEEGPYFVDKLKEIGRIITTMPKTYETDGQGGNAIVRLHYFTAGCDWWITEKDMEEEQLQAFGFACLNGDWEMAELGYISITEILEAGAELDLHWKPVPLSEAKKRAQGL